MSHVVDCKVKFKDLGALEDAAKACGLELRMGQRTYKWYGRSVGGYALPEGTTEADLGVCDHALHVVGNDMAYEIGVVACENGSWKLRYDFWQGGYGLMEKVGGSELKKLESEYLSFAVQRKAQELGWYCEKQTNGEMMLHVPGGGVVSVSPSGTIEAHEFIGPGCQAAVDQVAAALGETTAQYCKPEHGMLVQNNSVVGS